MCLILIAYKKHPDYELIVAANRDEFYKRATKPAHYWEEHSEILAGRDLEAGGTWMGVNTKGEVSMLTNYRDLTNLKNDAPSRGHLVSDFLITEMEAREYLAEVEQRGEKYNGFNMICGNPSELYYYGNYQEGVHEIGPGIHGLSNALLNTDWPKVEKGKKRLEQVLSKSNFEHQELFETLYDDVKAPEELLPDTGVGLEKEKMLSPMFIKSPEYGSRCSTILLIDKKGRLTFSERTYNIKDFSYEDRTFRLDL